MQTAILGTLGSTAILSATLFYLWRQEPAQKALHCWSLAFLAQSLRMGAQIGITLGFSSLWIVTDALFAITVLFIWLGTCELGQQKKHLLLTVCILTLTIVWQTFAKAQALPFIAQTLPLYAVACAVMLMAARQCFILAHAYPGIGYRGLGLLFAALGLHYLDYPFLRTVTWFAPFGFGLAAILMLCMGIAMLIITQRRQQFEIKELAKRLQAEISVRREAESRYQELDAELEASSERFRAITENSELGVVVADKRGHFVYCNPRYLAMANTTMDEVQSGLWIEHLHPDDREPIQRNWEFAVASQRGFTAERRVLLNDGAVNWLSVHIVPIHNSKGEFQGFVSTVEDITARKRAEEALRRNEEKFRAIFDQAFQFIGLMAPDGTLLDANRSALQFAGIAPEDVLGKPFWDTPWWQNPDGKAKLIQAIQDANQGKLVRFEATHPAADGTLHYVDFSLKPLFNDDGSVRMLIPEGRDITALKKAEEALRLSEARFSGAFHASLDYITISRIDTGEIIDVNEAFETITGWRREEAIGKTSIELGLWTNPDDRKHLIEQMQTQKMVREFPMKLRLRNGNTLDGLVNASMISIGDTQLLLGVVRDISTQRKMEEALRQNEEKFSRIVQYSPVALVITDMETGRLTDINRAWQNLFGYSRQQVIGKTSAEFGLWVNPEDRTLLYHAILEGQGALDRFECRYRHADGHIVYGLASGRQFDIGGRPSYLWSITDITLRHEMEERMAQINTELEDRVEERTAELRRTQEELIRSEKMAALGALVAGIAHELNTPIGNSVTVASTLHEMTEEFSRQIESGSLKRSSLTGYLNSATTASDLLLRSLSNASSLVSSFKQVAVDQTSDKRRKFDLAEAVDGIITTLSPTLRKTPFKVILEIPAGIVMDSFPGPLGQVITNLVNNAVIHAFEGCLLGNITLTAALCTDNSSVTLTVRDDGKGISKADLRRIFDPFFTTKLGRGGSGLGLNIVYNIATSVLGGNISVSSNLGQGTAFVLTMPLSAPVHSRLNDTDTHDTNDQPNA
ncbi:MAG: PAS domain S-box protein [Zoogloeaceae bacterium]|nr:PAS domain S-box protein [Zoogloeaceae bacterium]